MAGEIESTYDQSLLITPEEEKLFCDVDTVIENSILQLDPQPALEFGRNLRREGQLKGLALAKLLAKLNQNWEKFKASGMDERIEDVVYVSTGIAPITTRKYVRLWEDLFENPTIPDEVKTQLKGKSIKSLLLLTAAAKDGDDIDWKAVSKAESGAEIRDLVRDVRGPATSSESALFFTLDRDGTIYVRKGSEAQKTMIGKLLIGQMDNPIIEKAITKLVDRGGILWQ